ncbi:MAG: P-II family nitrogen regulator [Coleofasciculaceae cyanobacterium SM2_1_6]|nr:P-II family nitrogen regulator [Coleofasciculaceae cyanobacterium SM2_1_6]
MESVKRIEIIANSQELNRLLRILDKAKVPGYTVIRNVVGRGQRSTTDDDLVDTSTSNAYVLCFCQEEKIAQIEEEIRPVLNRFGGVCFVSEAMQINALKCIG